MLCHQKIKKWFVLENKCIYDAKSETLDVLRLSLRTSDQNKTIKSPSDIRQCCHSVLPVVTSKKIRILPIDGRNTAKNVTTTSSTETPTSRAAFRQTRMTTFQFNKRKWDQESSLQHRPNHYTIKTGQPTTRQNYRTISDVPCFYVAGTETCTFYKT